MNEPPQKAPKIRQSGLGTLGLALSIPGLMLAAPVVAALIGMWLDRKFGTGSKLTLICLVLGLAAGARETVRLVKRISSDQNEKK